MDNKTQVGIIILRLGLAAVFLWFGISQLSHAGQWLRVVPEWASAVMAAETIVKLNGIFEVVSGIMLALGVCTRFFAVILAIHLFVIASSFGLSPIGVRDFGLAFATVALAFMGGGKWALTHKKTAETL